MKSFIIVEDLEGLRLAALNGIEIAVPVNNKEIYLALKEVICDGYHYNGGAIFTLNGTMYQYMYL